MNNSETPRDNSTDDRIVGIKALNKNSVSLETEILTKGVKIIEKIKEQEKEAGEKFLNNKKLESLNSTLNNLANRKNKLLKQLANIYKKSTDRDYLKKAQKEN